MCINIYIYIHIYIHRYNILIHLRTYICVYMYLIYIYLTCLCMYVCMYVYTHMYTHTYTHVYTHSLSHAHAHTQTPSFSCTHIVFTVTSRCFRMCTQNKHVQTEHVCKNPHLRMQKRQRENKRDRQQGVGAAIRRGRAPSDGCQ